MNRIMTVSRDSRWTARLVLAAAAALLWVGTFGAMTASAAPGEGKGQTLEEDRGGGGGSDISVRWR